MKDANLTRSEKAKNVTFKERSNSDEPVSTQPDKPVVYDSDTLIHSRINEVFQKDNTTRAAIANNLKKRSTASSAFTQRAQSVFSTFKPSRLSSDVRLRPNFLQPDGNLLHVQKTVMTEGINSIKKSDSSHTIRLAESDELGKLIKETPPRAGAIARTINLDTLMSGIVPHFP
jgi:hypothetical protein